MIDRLPPQSLEAEQSVLGAILIDRDAVVEVAEFLRPQDFYRQANARIYAADPRAVRPARTDRHRHRRRDARAQGRTRGDRRARLPLQPVERDPHRGPCRPVRPDRRTQGRPARADRGGRAGSRASATRTRPRSRRPSTAPRRSSSRSARSASMPGSVRSRRCSTTPTTGSTTCTPTAARSVAFGRASRTWTRSRPGSRRAT